MDSLTPEDFKLGLLKTVDDEAAAARDHGYPLAAYGLVLRDSTGKTAWLNRAHPDFAEAVGRAKADNIAFVGLTNDGSDRHYLHMSLGHETDAESAHVQQLVKEMIEKIGLPTKETLFFAPS